MNLLDIRKHEEYSPCNNYVSFWIFIIKLNVFSFKLGDKGQLEEYQLHNFPCLIFELVLPWLILLAEKWFHQDIKTSC